MGRRERVGGFIGNALLNLAAIGGLICLVLVVLAFAFNVTLVMFKTGSMSPTIPAGSVAVVREIPASQITVGDVLTVDRAGTLPITHRVTSVSAGARSAERVITMKGDANESEDPLPYTLTAARIVLGSMPGLAYFIVWLSNPLVLGTLAIAASALVTWAFWPRGVDGARNARQSRERGQARGPRESGEPQMAPKSRETGRARERRDRGEPREARGRHTRVGAIVAPLLVALGLCLTPPEPSFAATPPTPSASAAAAVQTQAWRTEMGENVIVGDHLTLTSIGDASAMRSLAPGAPVHWEVGVAAAGAEPGQMQVSLAGNGSTELGLNVMVSACEHRWVDAGCAAGAAVVQESGPVALDGVERMLAVMPSTQQCWFMLEVWQGADTATPRAPASVELRLRATAAGEDLSTSPGTIGSIATTGANPWLPALVASGAIALGLLAAGAATLLRRRAR